MPDPISLENELCNKWILCYWINHNSPRFLKILIVWTIISSHRGVLILQGLKDLKNLIMTFFITLRIKKFFIFFKSLDTALFLLTHRTMRRTLFLRSDLPFGYNWIVFDIRVFQLLFISFPFISTSITL